MWPFKKKTKAISPPELPAPALYTRARDAGSVTKVMFDYLEVDGVRYDCRCPLVELGQEVCADQPVGKL